MPEGDLKMEKEYKTIKGWRKPVAIAVGSLAAIVSVGALGGCNGYQEFSTRHPETTREEYDTLVRGYDTNREDMEKYLNDLAINNKNIDPSDGTSDLEKAEAVLEIRKKINAAIVGSIFMSSPGN